MAVESLQALRPFDDSSWDERERRHRLARIHCGLERALHSRTTAKLVFRHG